MTAYLEESADSSADVLKWWKQNYQHFGDLGSLARMYLSIPASSASVERLFSRAGLIAILRRSRLSPQFLRLCVLMSLNHTHLK